MSLITTQQRLQHLLITLRQDIATHPDGQCRLPRFDSQLFRSKGTRLADYLAEVEQNFTRLCDSAGDPDRSAWLAERLVDQIAALQREASTQQLRTRREKPLSNPRVSKYQEYREYERRLLAMIDQREQRLALAETLAVQHQLKHDLETLEGRLARCRQAIRSVEWALSLRGDQQEE
ncbi:primosomal replication protein N'' [Pantoea sp. AN62]|uniref:primosomal replication protein PriC n=1 Tax=Pantoea TaxID=53335 RepID=UPI000A251D9F|nr:MULTISPECIES: primosomal replication protein [Pantoea]MDU4746506.1 primosomal replication protein [Pantoea sp.]MCQ5470933.1 primosomal replication protein [Pantoea brenneri]ORM56725.1 PriC [Pantoea brenneri]OXM21379.1 PriC [Pantoea sp. AV62]HAI07658.1 PriC [Pantoea sp.]